MIVQSVPIRGRSSVSLLSSVRCRTLGDQRNRQTSSSSRLATVSTRHGRRNAVWRLWPRSIRATKILLCSARAESAVSYRLRERFGGISGLVSCVMKKRKRSGSAEAPPQMPLRPIFRFGCCRRYSPNSLTGTWPSEDAAQGSSRENRC